METGHSLDDWYTASAAAEVLTRNSRKKVRPDYLRSLARQGVIRTKKIGARTMLYLKADVDGYIVEARGKKAGAAAKARSSDSPSGVRDDGEDAEEQVQRPSGGGSAHI